MGIRGCLPVEHTMADSKKRNANENSSDEEDREDPKLTWHVPEVIYITDSEEECQQLAKLTHGNKSNSRIAIKLKQLANTILLLTAVCSLNVFALTKPFTQSSW